LAVTAGLKTLEILRRPGSYEKLETISSALVEGLRRDAKAKGVPVIINRVGSMFTVFFTSSPVTDYVGARTSETKRFAAFFRALLDRGVYFPPAQFEAAFVSLAHSDEDVAQTIQAAAEALAELAR
jgi:glutamate-1-semialdehyde 2,1-aminomutase